MPYIKNHIRVTVPRRSGFDKSFRNSGTLTCGTITPILCDEVIPGTRCSLRLNLATQLPPLASDTYMNLKLKAEAFFVPMRICCGSFESFFSDFGQPGLNGYYQESTVTGNSGYIYTDDVKGAIPSFVTDFSVADADLVAKYFGPGSLIDYLGCRLSDSAVLDGVAINPLPLVAYGLIYQEWYRNPRVQKPLFVRLYDANDIYNGAVDKTIPVSSMPFTFYRYASNGTNPSYTVNGNSFLLNDDGVIEPSSMILADGSSIFDLRQRNFGLDYFTGSRVAPQQGDAASVVIPVASNQGTMTIAQLRAANSLQQFRERNNLPSPRMVDQVKARYGANLADGVAQRPICIGSASYDVASTGISQTGVGSESGNNPFSSVAAQYGRAYGAGSDFIINDFVASEPGYVIVNVTLVPEATYATGLDRMFRRYISQGSIVEMATPLLQNVGDQAILNEEIVGEPSFGKVFGYTDRYADFMFKPNVVHGLMRDGQSLQSFVLQRSFPDSDTELSSEFLEIPKNYLDGVFAVNSDVSGLSAWYDAMLDWKVSMPLAEFSIPSLQDPAYEHGQSVSLRRNGQIF